MKSSVIILAVAAGHVPVAWAQAQWAASQNSTRICTWSQLRAAIIQDTVYLDGGDIYWLPGFDNGTFGLPTTDGNPLSLVYTLDLNEGFNTTTNTTSLLKTLSRKGVAPNYIDGALLGNNHEWFSYGGLLRKSDGPTPNPDANSVFVYQKDSYGADKPGFTPGFYPRVLSANVTRYLAYGGGASAPSENKAWYFGGYGSPSGGPIFTVSGNSSDTAYTPSDTLVELDMTTQLFETWSNLSLPDSNVTSRANPELVWVPVGAKGILVVLGGVLYPNFIEASGKSANESGSRSVSPDFMSDLDIYDIATRKWHKQPTTGGPGQLTRGCAVVGTARDGSSYNIYYYGGYDGLNEKTGARDEVWILSLPSFMWMKLSSGSPSHARVGHKCVKPYPDQMMVVGGYSNMTDSGAYSCVGGSVVQMLNMTDGSWMNGYDPNNWNNYSVPAMIYNMIGGDAAGGATQLAPQETGFADGGLSDVFQTPYPMTRITTYYPYGSGTSAKHGNDASSGSSPSVVGAVVGSILGVVAIAAALAAWCLLRRRRRRAQAANKDEADVAMSELGTSGPDGHRTTNWVEQQTEKSPTSVNTGVASPESPHGEAGNHHEMEAPLYAPVELMDTSTATELGDTGLSHTQVLEKHSHFGEGGQGAEVSLSDPSYYSEQASLVSHSNGFFQPLTPPQHQRNNANLPVRADSPPKPPPQQHGDMVFGPSTGDYPQLRNVSAASDVTIDSTASRVPASSHWRLPNQEAEGSEPPPSPTIDEGSDSLTPGKSSSVNRRSMFLEDPDDLDGPTEGTQVSRPSTERR